MITRERLNHGEGDLVEENPNIGSRKRTSQSENMASEEGLSHEKKEFQKTFFAMSEMMKVLYEDYMERKRPILGEYSKVKNEEGEDPSQTPLHLLLLHQLLLLQVQVLSPPQENIPINIKMKCLYLSLM
jgi:hypothetical protein